MIVGFSRHGQGRAQGVLDYLLAENSAGGALDYLLGEKNKAGVRRSPLPVVLRGDPALTGKLINSSPFQWRYTSGVLSFSKGERITPEMENKIMDEFEAAAFAGLSRDRYDILWVRHAHTGREEMHFVVPRMELATGRSMNIAPPVRASRQLFDTFRSKINAEYGLSDPDDPARRRLLSLPPTIAKLRSRWALDNARIRQAIHDCIATNVANGTIRSRDAVIGELQSAGFKVVRLGEDYLTVLQPITGKRFRLRGECYRKDWTGVRQRALLLRGRSVNRAATFAAQLSSLCRNRAEFNLKAYGLPPLQPPTPLPAYDRTGNTSLERAQTVGGTIPAARPAVCRHAVRLDQAAERWLRADRDLERAVVRFGGAHRAFATDLEQTLAARGPRQARVLRTHQYTLSVRPAPSPVRRALDWEMEPEMEVEYP